MEIKKHLFKISAFAAVLTLNIGVFANLNRKGEVLDAYDTESLPSTIYLNDSSESDIRNYYSNLNGLSDDQRQGTNLLKNLKSILATDQKYYSYDSGNAIWQMYEIIDRDWEKSPAESTTYGSYYESTNIITGYKYGTSGSNSKNNPYIHALYINREIENETRAWGDHNQDAWGINREHIWAKSHGFDTLVSKEDTGGARGDPMHLWAGNGWANHEHLNYFFAFVDKNRDYSDAGDKYSTVYDNLTGYSLNAGGNQKVFEPQDCDKGDIARSIFYMAARYNNYVGFPFGFDSNNPNLILLNDLSENSRTGTSSANDPYGMGLLCDLLAWNKLDPVDEFEIHRNNLLYKNYTNNRNPFIDFPEWADVIWGTANLDGTNYDSTPVGIASPSTDAIAAPVVQFEMSLPRVRLEIGNTCGIYGKNTEGAITWSIADTSIATINKTSTTGSETVTVTGLKSGRTTISATCGGKTITNTVIVSEAVPINYGTQDEPLTITEAKELIDNNNPTLDKMFVKGVVSSSTYNSTFDNYDIWLESEDGSEPEGFKLYRATMSPSITKDYTAENALVGKEVIVQGYGSRFNTTYELAPNNEESPVIRVVKLPGEKTPKDLVEEQTTTSSLAYHYNKEENAPISATDTLVKADTGVSGNSYSDWEHSYKESGITYKGNSAGGNGAIQLRSNNNNSGIVVSANQNGMTATSISVSWAAATLSGRTINVYGNDTAYTDPTDLYATETQGTLIGTIKCDTNDSLTITGEYQYIGLRSNKDTLYLDDINIQWDGYGTVYEYSNMSIRFGGSITQELWNDLDTDSHVIEGFGVMIVTDDVVNENMEIKDFYESAASAESEPNVFEEIVDYFVPVDQLETIMGVEGNNYFWNLRYSITDFKTTYVAAAYIKTATSYIFFQQARYSAKSLAQDHLDNRGYDATIAGGSLANLADL